jgi:transketolase
VGPVAGSVWAACMEQPEATRPNLWCLSHLPVASLPDALWDDLARSPKLVIAEEHVAQGSAGRAIAMELVQAGRVPAQFRHVTALGYPSGLYGSQKFHRAECGLDPASLLADFNNQAAP